MSSEKRIYLKVSIGEDKNRLVNDIKEHCVCISELISSDEDIVAGDNEIDIFCSFHVGGQSIFMKRYERFRALCNLHNATISGKIVDGLVNYTIEDGDLLGAVRNDSSFEDDLCSCMAEDNLEQSLYKPPSDDDIVF